MRGPRQDKNERERAVGGQAEIGIREDLKRELEYQLMGAPLLAMNAVKIPPDLSFEQMRIN